MAKGATLGQGDRLIFGDGTHSIFVKEIDTTRKTVKVIAHGPSFIKVESSPKESRGEVAHVKKS